MKCKFLNLIIVLCVGFVVLGVSSAKSANWNNQSLDIPETGSVPDAILQHTWDKAVFFVPELGVFTKSNLPNVSKKYPTVLFMHGCGGITEDSRKWAAFLNSLGVLVIMPNSFAIPNRSKNCLPGQRNAGGNGKMIGNLRKNEIGYGVKQMKALSIVDMQNTFLFGHSEGGAAVTRVKGKAFRGVISSGYKCVSKIMVAPSVPILFLNHERDPYFPKAKEGCNNFLSSRSTVSEVLSGGEGHNNAHVKAAQVAVRDFMQLNKK
jgi:dienelactone hydrolase